MQICHRLGNLFLFIVCMMYILGEYSLHMYAEMVFCFDWLGKLQKKISYIGHVGGISIHNYVLINCISKLLMYDMIAYDSFLESLG